MPAVARIGDLGTDGDPAITGSPNVFVNGIPWHRKGDLWPVDVTVTGSRTVHVNNTVGARIGDLAVGVTPHAIATGSPNVFAGG